MKPVHIEIQQRAHLMAIKQHSGSLGAICRKAFVKTGRTVFDGYHLDAVLT